MYVACDMSDLFLKVSSETEQMRVCLAEKIGGIFCISLLCQREKELGAVSIGASFYIFKKRLGLSKVEKTSLVYNYFLDGKGNLGGWSSSVL